jgi:hypothetical protein
VEFLLKERGVSGSGPAALEAYQLIFTFFVEIVQLEILSEKELSDFFHCTTSGKLILSHFFKTFQKLGRYHANLDINQLIFEDSHYGPANHLDDLISSCEWRFEFSAWSKDLAKHKIDSPLF